MRGERPAAPACRRPGCRRPLLCFCLAHLNVICLALAAQQLPLLQRPRDVRQPQAICQHKAASCDWRRFDFEVLSGADFGESFPRGPFEAAVADGIARRLSQGIEPVCIHIGPSDLMDSDLELWRTTALLPCRKVFVEPWGPIQTFLRQRLEGAGFTVGPKGRTRLLHAAVCPDDFLGDSSSSGARELTIYGFGQRLFADYPRAYHARVHHFTSLLREVPLFALFNVAFREGPHGERQAPEDYAELGLANLSKKDWESYLEAVPVRCLAPSKLLAEVTASPASLTLLIVDAEGVDAAIVARFLAIEGFSPDVVMWEWVADREQTVKLAEQLLARGFDIYQDYQDIIAIAPSSTLCSSTAAA